MVAMGGAFGLGEVEGEETEERDFVSRRTLVVITIRLDGLPSCT